MVSWFLVDRLGSTVALTASDGSIQTSYIYGPFGNTQVSGQTNDNPYQFAGREADPAVGPGGVSGGIYYSRGRYLDTGLSRFVSRDPAGFLTDFKRGRQADTMSEKGVKMLFAGGVPPLLAA